MYGASFHLGRLTVCFVHRLDNEMGFVVLSRPNAFKQYFEKCGDIEEDYVLMAEPDHLYLRPLQNLMNGRTAAAFPFFYINPKGELILIIAQAIRVTSCFGYRVPRAHQAIRGRAPHGP